MNFEQIWQQYDFTEAELLNMGWQLPGDYVLHLNYYWDEWGQVSDRDRPLTVILLDCTRLTVQLNPTRPKSGYQSHLGTIVGWGLVTPSEWLLPQKVAEDLWLHLRFEIGSDSFIEALCRSLAVQQQEFALSVSSA